MSTSPEPPLSAAALAEHDALAPGSRLGELEVLRILGVGGFGIVYLARDHSLEREVALKEYMPASLARRGEGAQITIRSASFVDTYAIGLRSFINEAKLLARFDHPSLVKVYRFWEGNGTAYMVMPYLQGHTLRDVRRAMSQPPTEGWIRGVIDRVLGALEVMHREGVFHRDIAPDNILITPEGLPILLDFGAARRVISDRTQTLTAILKPNYAPIEQYADMVQMRQGPWTDLYALGAVVHFLLKGMPPMPATARLVQDDLSMLQLPAALGVSPRFLKVIDWALALRPQDRPQDVAALRAALEGRLDPPPVPRQGVTVPGPTALMPVAEPTGSDGPTLRMPSRGEGPTQLEPTFAPTQRLSTGPTAPQDASGTSVFPTTIAAQSDVRPPATAPDSPPPKTRLDFEPPMAAEPAALPRPETPRRRSMVALVGVAAALAGAAAVWALIGRPSPTAPAASGPALAQPASPSVASQAPSASAPVVAVPSAPVVVAPPPELVAPVPTAAASAPAAVPPVVQGMATPSPAVRTTQPAVATRPRRAAPTEAAVATESGSPATMTAPIQSPPRQAAVTQPAIAVPSAQAAADDPDEDVNAPRASLVTTARQICGNRPLYAMAECMQRQCRRPRFATDLDCLRLGPVSNRRLGDPP
jgi:serine/threonine protein kinase